MKINLKKKIIIPTLLCILFFGLIAKTSAVISQYYGGLRAVNVQCTCSAASLLIVYDFKTKTTINLAYYPGYTKLYEYYNLYSSTYLLGSYNPALSAGVCLFVVGNSCVDASAIGLSLRGTLNGMIPGDGPGTGTSLK